jgi:lycopene beta-cyclase
MRFDPDTEYGVSFTYLLPFNKRQALIETTVFCAKPVDQVTLTARLQSVVDRMLPGKSVSLQRQEYAVLPMGVIDRARPDCNGLVRVGLTAGAARPSSGYAFQRIQHWATLCAKSILVGGPVLAHAKEPWLARSMDSLFLRVLRQHPEQGPTIFMAMFKNMRIARIVRFMNDEATWLDRFLLIKSMPLWVFLTQVPFALFRRP